MKERNFHLKSQDLLSEEQAIFELHFFPLGYINNQIFSFSKK